MRPCHTRASSSLIIERQTVSNASCASQNSPLLNNSRACSRDRRRSAAAICCLPSAISRDGRLTANGRQLQKVQCPVTAGDGPDQDLRGGTRRSSFTDQAVARTDCVRREHADAKNLMPAYEQCRPAQ